MHIGVTVYFQESFFSAGAPQTALAIAEVFRLAGHDVSFVNVHVPESKETTVGTWWDDVKTLKKEWNIVQLNEEAPSKEKEQKKFDVLFEIGQHWITPEQRQKICQTSIWVCRKAPLLSDIEAVVFPFLCKPNRSMEGVKEVWVFDEMVTNDDVEYLEVQTRRPVRKVPFVWTPSAIELHRQETKSPVWQQVATLPEVINGKRPWEFHICETNSSSTSSCTIPLFIAAETVKKSKNLSISCSKNVIIHNADTIKGGEFFQKNVFEKVLNDISGNFAGRVRCPDFVYSPMSCILAHSRFLPLRPYLLEFLWVGVPLLHNSIWIQKNIGNHAFCSYYPDNEISKGHYALEKLLEGAKEALQQNGGVEEVVEVRKKIVEKIGPFTPAIQQAYGKALLNSLTNTTSVETTSVEKTPILSIQPVLLQKNEQKEITKEIRVGFCDMWADFNAETNQFVAILQHVCPKDTCVKGVSLEQYAPGQENVHLVVFGPFGERWHSVKKEIPLVFYTGENTPPVKDDRVKLTLGFDKKNFSVRLPLWMLEINWFGLDPEAVGNPKPFPLEWAQKADTSTREKFCAFVVSNPCQEVRNKAFQWLSEYKRVDSAGRLFNNVGSDLFAGLGGGGGELKKIEFFRKYKYALTYENAESPGYCTEKMLHAKVAGCIPIYWGDPEVEKDFDTRGFLDARSVKSKEELIALVKKIEENSSLYEAMRSIPALDEVREKKARGVLREVGERMLALVEKKEQAKESKKIPSPNSTVFVTATNMRFLPSLQIWLQAMGAQKEHNPEMKVLVYMMSDISEEIQKTFEKNFPFAQYLRFPTETPQGFADMWNPQHFAWKIWIYQELVKKEEFAGKIIFYSDCGSMLCRYPREWLTEVVKNGICCLDDSTQINRSWCHEYFCKALQVTEEELQTHQTVAGIVAFVGGHPLAQKVFAEAWTWAQQKEVIVGPKYYPPEEVKNGCLGHRHDQSILSIVSQRNNVPRYPLEKVYCHTSLRQTFLSGCSLYVHRGNFNLHQQVLPGIDDVYVINLDRRQDRLEKCKKNHPEIAERLLRIPAFDGRSLQMTPRLARLFAPHDFKWKKSVMGCALSHLDVWMKLLNDKPEIESYLVLEDDVLCKRGWQEAWTKAWATKSIPEDWDIVYLGGILPPNRDGFEQMCVEKVNEHVGRIKPNQVFGQPVPTRYMHFCAYAYVLSRRGAMKVVEYMKSRGGYWTSADHMMCNLYDIMNIYFLHPLVAGCYQDDDPVYQQSAFNDFSRKDNFDSDLWNNNEHFTEEEVSKALKAADEKLDILGTLEEARGVKQIQTKQPEILEETKSAKAKAKETKRRFVSIAGPAIKIENLYEKEWCKEIFEQQGLIFEIEDISSTAVSNPPTDEPIVVFQRPYSIAAREVLEGWKAKGISFYIFHISDEFGKDPVDFYEWPECKGVLRNYVRPDVKESDKVKIIPLGYHWSFKKDKQNEAKQSERKYAWSFVGTNWQGRKEKLEVLKKIPHDYKLVFQEGWDAEGKLGREEMIDILEQSLCVPCPGGQNPETFRAYEALEAGAIPVFVKEGDSGAYLTYLSRWLTLLHCDSWTHAAQLILTLKAKPEVYKQYHERVMEGWKAMRNEVKQWVKTIYNI